ncbi:hypothetical protein BGX33_009299 [Mortierella sp. NVP41]|nr:hypothetical protein BGX33_009299 [Mortierella sp. NVP41]
MAAEEHYQSFRRGPDSRVVKIETYFHEETGQHLVDWDDVTDAFPNVTCVMNGPIVVSRAKDSRRKAIEPRCIKYHHDIVLEVVIGDVFSPEVDSILSPPPIPRTATPDIQLNVHVPVTLGSQNYLQLITPESNQPNPVQQYRCATGGESTPCLAPWHSSATAQDGNRIMEIGDDMESLHLTNHSSQSSQTAINVYNNTTALHSDPDVTCDIPLTAIATAIANTESAGTFIHTEYLLQRMESKVQSVEHFIREGQLLQARVVQQEVESIKQEMTQYHEKLQNEVAKNTNLQNELNKTAKRILELQEVALDTDKRMLLLQQQAMDRLALILNKATAILTQTYELHEFPIPRLFIILPKEDITKREKIGTMFVKRFRLYFLCECGEHTKPIDGIPSTLSHDIHLARHDGYDLDRPNEFFAKYGSYVLALLQMLKYGVVAAGMVVPALNSLKISDGLAVAEAGLKVVEKSLAPRVDSAIEYFQGLTAAQDGVSKELGNANSNASLEDPTTINQLEGLEGADLRHLGSFLKISDEGKVLGNLYRTVTPKGHVKWVCLDHYRESYGAAALQGFKESVELINGQYDQRTGRVTVRLASTEQARLFYTLLLSTRLVHELELTLDWNTTFEDLRTLKNVMQQSNIFHLGLDLCGKTGPTSDFVYRSRRSEPLVQIMASGKIHTMILRNVTGFLSQTKELLKTTFHVQHFDLGDRLTTVEDFIKLEKLIRASPVLVHLSIVVGNIDGAFTRLRPLVAQHKALSILDLQLQDGTAASVQFEKGSDQIIDIGLKVVEFDSIDLMKMPMVTSVVFLAKNSPSRSSDLVRAAMMDCRQLKVVKIMQLPDGRADVLQSLQQIIYHYSSQPETEEASVEDAGTGSEGKSNVAVMTVERIDTFNSVAGFLKLDLLHNRSMFWDMELLIASYEEGETSEEKSLETLAPTDKDIHRVRSTFILRRRDGSLGSVRFALDEGGSNSAVLNICDFEASEVYQHSLATKLTVVGIEGAALFDKLVQGSPIQYSNLRTLELECRTNSLLEMLLTVQLATSQCPAFDLLNIWDSNDRTMREFSFPLRELHLHDYLITDEQLPSLQNLLCTAPGLSLMILSVFSLSEVFDVVSVGAQLRKTLRHVRLIAGPSRASIHFAVSSGDAESISLRVGVSELNQLLSLPMVTELELGSLAMVQRSRLKEIATLVFTSYRHLKTFKMLYRSNQLLDFIDTFHQVANETSASCRMILFEVDDTSGTRKNAFDLPLKTLDITLYNIDREKLEIVERLIRTSPLLEELYLSVPIADTAQRIFDFIFQERKPMTTLSFTLQDGRMAAFSLEKEQEKDALTVTQKITQAGRDGLFLLPNVKIESVRVVGDSLNKHDAAEITTMVLRQCHTISSIIFPGLPNQIQDLAAILEDSIKNGSFIRELKRNNDTTDHEESGFSISAIENVGGIAHAGLALYSSCVDRGQGTRKISSIVRVRLDGSLEAIGLDLSDPDGITLQLNPVAFDESNLGELPPVRELDVFIIPDTTTLVDNLIRIPLKRYPQLSVLHLKSSDGYVMLIRIKRSSQDNVSDQYVSRRIESIELQVSRALWFKSSYYPTRVTKLTISPEMFDTQNNYNDDDGNGDKSNRILKILSAVEKRLSGLKYLVLECSLSKFFGLLPTLLDLSNKITQLDLQDPVDHKTVISINVGTFSTATIYLEKISDRDLHGTLHKSLPKYLLQAEVTQRADESPVISIHMHCFPKTLRVVRWDTQHVPYRRVFELLDRFFTRSKDGSRLPFQFKWWIESKLEPWQTTGDGAEGVEGRVHQRPKPSEILSDKKIGVLLARLLVRGAMRFDIEYKVVKALMPFIQTVLEAGDFEEVGPFSLLDQYYIDYMEDPVHPAIQDFQSILMARAQYSFNDPDSSAPKISPLSPLSKNMPTELQTYLEALENIDS